MAGKTIEIDVNKVKETCDKVYGCSICHFYIPVIGGKGCYFKHVQPYLWDLEYIAKGMEEKK